jgi:hypothetical protein
MSNLSSLVTQTVGSSTAGVNLIQAPNSASIWTNSGLSNVGTSTTQAELPLYPSVPTATKFSLGASAGSAYCDIDIPSALVGTKLGLGWFARCSSSFTATITLTLTSYLSSSNRSTNTSPTSVTLQTSTVAASALQFYTSFDTTTNQFLRLTINFTGLAAAWYSLCQFQVGPGQMNQGAAVSYLGTYTPVLTSTGATNLGLNASRNVLDIWRIADVLKIRGTIQKDATALGGTLTNPLFISLPTGLTSAKAGLTDYKYGTYSRYATAYEDEAPILNVLGSGIGFANPTTTSVRSAGSFPANTYIYIDMEVPISEWSGSGTLVMGQGAQVEYASTSEGWTATGSTTVYGPQGQAITGSLASSVTKTITWQYPIQPEDLVIVEGSIDRITWTPMNMMAITGGIIVPGLNSDATVMAGVACGNLSQTQTKVTFGRYIQISNDDTPVYDWPASGLYWRCRKSKSSAPVGFGLAGNGVSGLISSEYASADGDLGTITIGAGTWTTIDSKKYKWNRVGKQVTLWYRLESTTAASALQSFLFVLPSDCPTPVGLSNAGSTEWTGFSGSAGSCVSLNGSAENCTTHLYNGGGTFNVYHIQASSATKLAWGSLTYMTA